MSKEKKLKVLLAGGGTGGPVMPLIAVKQYLQSNHPETEFLYLGTNTAHEKAFAKENSLPFKTIPTAKLRRYFSLSNIATPFLFIYGFLKSFLIILNFKPDIIFGAGGFVSVPAMYAGFLLKKKILVHQQDVEPGLANKLVSPIATAITVTFENSARDFFHGSGFFGHQSKVYWTGNPVRDLDPKRGVKEIKKDFGLHEEMPVLLALGGATGALGLNKILEEALPDLVSFVQVLHSTGKGKAINFDHPNYHPYEIIVDMPGAYAVADFVVARAGLSTITELSAAKKASIIIPMPNSHQFSNALALSDNEAAIVFSQDELDGELLVSSLRKLMYDYELQKDISENISKIMPHDASEKISKIIVDLCQEKQ